MALVEQTKCAAFGQICSTIVDVSFLVWWFATRLHHLARPGPCAYYDFLTNPLMSSGSSVLQSKFRQCCFQEQQQCCWFGSGYLRLLQWNHGSHVSPCPSPPNCNRSGGPCMSSCCFFCHQTWPSRGDLRRWLGSSDPSNQWWTVKSFFVWPYCGWHPPSSFLVVVLYILSCETKL